MLNLIDEYRWECLAIHPRRRLNSGNVIEVLADAMIKHGIPEHIRSDNGPEFVAKELRKWLANTETNTLYIEPGSPWENGYCESFNSKLSDEFLKGEVFYSLKEIQILAERWRIYYNTERPHSSLGYRPPEQPDLREPRAFAPVEILFPDGRVPGKSQAPLANLLLRYGKFLELAHLFAVKRGLNPVAVDAQQRLPVPGRADDIGSIRIDAVIHHGHWPR